MAKDGFRIKHLADADPIIDDNTKIVRYMKLSTFLLLLADRVFLPSLQCLQRGDDKLEGLVPQTIWRRYGHNIALVTTAFEDWLLKQSSRPKIIREEGKEDNSATLQFLAKVWLEQLSIRRCVWCWNLNTGQSQALWKLYGQRGAAVSTTVGAVRRAFGKVGPVRGIVSPVQYWIPRRYSGGEADDAQMMIRRGNKRFPYLYKDAGYRHENELRFVFGVHPDLLSEASGIITEIDGRSLIKDIEVDLWISPDVPRDEDVIIKRLAGDVLAGAHPPLYPKNLDEERLARYKAVGGNPFTMDDEPVGLFADLR